MAYTTTAREYIESLFERLGDDSPLRDVGGVVAFEIEGDNGGTWMLDLDNGKTASDDARPDCIVSASERDFMALVEGRMSVQNGLLTSRLVVAGEAARLVALMGTLMPPARGQ